jgi:hypothetical protein
VSVFCLLLAMLVAWTSCVLVIVFRRCQHGVSGKASGIGDGIMWGAKEFDWCMCVCETWGSGGGTKPIMNRSCALELLFSAVVQIGHCV